METALILIVAAAIVLFVGWHVAFLVKNFGSGESRRLYKTTH